MSIRLVVGLALEGFNLRVQGHAPWAESKCMTETRNLHAFLLHQGRQSMPEPVAPQVLCVRPS